MTFDFWTDIGSRALNTSANSWNDNSEQVPAAKCLPFWASSGVPGKYLALTFDF